MSSLAGTVAVVTGAGPGIGRATASLLADQGCQVIAADINLTAARETGLRNRAAYCASKGAVIALTRSLAVDHVGERVRVNCICPGTVDSPWLQRLIDGARESRAALVQRQPMGRLGTPEEIGKLVVYLASEDSAFMTGSAVVIDGGLTAG